MPTHEEAKAQLEAAQRAVAALSLIPDADNYEVGTILRWRTTGTDAVRVAIKAQPRGLQTTWSVAGRSDDYRLSWGSLVSMYLSMPLDFFEVAPEDWYDERVKPTPQVEVTVSETDGMTLTDTAGHVWDRRGDQWVLR